jgi:hypothetical protein
MEEGTKSTRLAAAEKELETALTNYSEALDAETKSMNSALPSSTLTGIINLINQAKSAFAPYGNTLTPAERKRLIGIGFKNLGFIERAYASAVANPTLVPRYLKIETFKMDVEDFARKRNLVEILEQFQFQVTDAMFVASDVAYRDALSYYNGIKEAARQRVPGAEAVYNALKDFFKHAKPTSTNSTEAEIERDVRSLLHGAKDGRIVIENEKPVVSEGKHRVVDEVHSERIALKEGLNTNVEE